MKTVSIDIDYDSLDRIIADELRHIILHHDIGNDRIESFLEVFTYFTSSNEAANLRDEKMLVDMTPESV